MAPQSFTAIKKQNRLEGLLTPWSLKILTSKKPQNSFQAKHFNCHKYFQPQPSLVHVHVILIDKQIPGPNKTERAQLVRYRYALYGIGAPTPKERPVSSITQKYVHFMKTKTRLSDKLRMDVLYPHNYSRYISVMWHCLYWTNILQTLYSIACHASHRYLTGLSLSPFYVTRSCDRQFYNQFHLIKNYVGAGIAYRPGNRQGPYFC